MPDDDFLLRDGSNPLPGLVDNIEATPKLIAPWVQSDRTRAIDEIFRKTNRVPMDVFDKPGTTQRVAPGVDCTAGLTEAASAGVDLTWPLSGGDYLIYDTINFPNKRTSIVGIPRFTFGTDTDELANRASAIKLMTPGNENLAKPLFRFSNEGCYVQGGLLRGLGASSNSYQTGIFVSKDFKAPTPPQVVPEFDGDADFYLRETRITGFETAIEGVGWGQKYEGPRTGDCRHGIKVGFPAPGTFKDEGGGQGSENGFRQIIILSPHFHATTFGIVNNGPQADKIKGMLAANIMADTGCQIFTGWLDGVLMGLVSINGENTPAFSKYSFLQISGGKGHVIGMRASGMHEVVYAALPDHLIQVGGTSRITFQGIDLRNCKLSAVQFFGEGLKTVDFDGLTVEGAHRVNNTSPTRPRGVFDVVGGSLDLRVSNASFECTERDIYAPIVTIDTAGGVAANGVSVDFEQAPRFDPARYTGLVQSGARLNPRRDRTKIELQQSIVGSTAPTTAPADVLENIIGDITVDGSRLGLRGFAEGEFTCSHPNSANNKIIRARAIPPGTDLLVTPLSSLPLLFSTTATTTAVTNGRFKIWNTGAETTQRWSRTGYGSSTVATDTSTMDTAQPWRLVITAHKSVGSENVTCNHFDVRVAYAG